MTDKYQAKDVASPDNNSSINVVENSVNQILTNILDPNITPFQNNPEILNITERQKLETSITSLSTNPEKASPFQTAKLEFILGLNEYNNDNIEAALAHFQKSLPVWEDSTKILPGEVITQQINSQRESLGVVVFYIGLCYNRIGDLSDKSDKTEANKDWQQAQINIQKCLDIFTQVDRQELVAKFISKKGAVLKKLEAWSNLYQLAQNALDLHLTYGTEEQIAEDYGFLAEAAMHESKWAHASQLAELALAIQDQSVVDPLEISQNQNSYTSILAESQNSLHQWQTTVKQLEKARRETNPHHDPHSYISILKALRKLYFEQDQYINAARIKEEQLKIEHQYGLRAFVGINQLQPQQHSEKEVIIAPEIEASGRLEDVNNLVARIKSDDHKLIVIYGASGVGKSSLLNAGLIPALLEEETKHNQVILPILLRVYTDWIRNPDSTTWNLEYVLSTLQKSNDGHNLKVLILDQFEELFSVCPKTEQRLPLYQFLFDCLNLSSVKVILSIQVDYLHYLLEYDRLTNLEAVINYEILSKETLYYVDDFSPNQAEMIIQSLNETTKLELESNLIDEIVKDLSCEVGTVRPIELQVVGRQLEVEAVTSLEKYYKLGDNPHLTLTINFLDEAIKDCGFLNERIAILVLYLLTNESGTRPLKTRAELGSDLLTEANKLDLVLDVLVAEGLVLLLPELPENRYQLAHDYLIPLVRKQEGEKLIAELELERDIAQRKLLSEKPHNLIDKAISSVFRWMRID
ncbi:MAG: hypothetical protein QNJ68_01255 [Microcoleaceae cyanobacterium MO_207.B10]|nr:hypothetical protein [Microcoleaceae cyanobacterium MO_207.B10]